MRAGSSDGGVSPSEVASSLLDDLPSLSDGFVAVGMTLVVVAVTASGCCVVAERVKTGQHHRIFCMMA